MSNSIEKTQLFVGKQPFYVYERFAVNALLQHGQVTILARGANIPRAISLAHFLPTKYTFFYMANEKTRIEMLPDDRPVESDETTVLANDTRRPSENRLRPVSVYEARIIKQEDAK